MATYIDQLKQANPTAYAQLEKLMSYTANENYGGTPQDYQAQIFTNLDTSKLNAPKSISANPDIQGGVPEGFTPQYQYESNGEFTTQNLTGYTKDLGIVNGIPIVANYDAQGNLTGYSGDQRMRNFVSGNQSYAGQWDVEGKAAPKKYTSSSGGVVSGLLSDLGPIAPLALSFALPGAGAALGSALGTSAAVGSGLIGAGVGALQGATGGDLLKGAALGTIGGAVGSNVAGLTDNATLGQIAGGTSSGLLSGKDLGTSLTNAAINTGVGALNTSATPASTPFVPSTDNYSVNADYGISAPESSGLGLKATPAQLDMSNPYSFDTTLTATGGLGLNASRAATAGNVADMGGGQGLLGNVGGKTIGEIGSAFQDNLTNTITGKPLGSELAGITTGAENYNINPSDSTGTQTGAISNLLGKLLMATTNTTGGTGTAGQNALSNVFGGLLGGAGSLYQGSTNRAANIALADQLRAAGKSAQETAMFRPVGVTTRFGSSNFQIDPVTGQLISAGYTAAPEVTSAQTNLMKLGAGYLAQTPEQVAADYMAKQQALLAPSREQAWANLANQDYNRGTTGLKVAQGGALQSANPYATALANAQYLQDLNLAAKAQEAGQNQVKFGAGLFGGAADLEKMAQQPLDLSTQLAKMFSSGNYNAANLGMKGNVSAAEVLNAANKYNPVASIMSGVGTSPLATSALGSLFGNTSLGSSLGNWLSGLGGSSGSYTGSAIYDGSSVSPDTYLYDDPNALYANSAYNNTFGD